MATGSFPGMDQKKQEVNGYTAFITKKSMWDKKNMFSIIWTCGRLLLCLAWLRNLWFSVAQPSHPMRSASRASGPSTPLSPATGGKPRAMLLLCFWGSAWDLNFLTIFFFLQTLKTWKGLVFHRGLLSQVLTGMSCIPGHRSLLPQKPHFSLSSPLGLLMPHY